ncbi:MAG: hypothetical protein KIH63_005530, partial [Candidatus Saccharibacteria bacterium]|nr:hypothetical protein [Candidatus Saccharibacteria bacterium]
MGDDTSLATQTAAIGFDASNNLANTGRLILNVQNGGSAAIQGYNTTNLGGDMLSCDIDFTTLAGQHALYQTISFGPGLWSAFEIVNENEIFPGLRRNPWCLDDNIVGFQPGFVLGANGVLDVADQTYVDYIGATTNFSPEPEIPEEVLANLAVNCISPLVNQVVKDRNASAFIVDGPASYCSGIVSAQPPVNWVGRPQIIMHGTSKIYFRSAVGCNGEGEDFLVDPAFQLTDRQGYGSIIFDVEGALDIIDADGTGNGKTLNILSIQEADTGGSVLIEASDVNFKLRTYARDGDGDYLQYGKAAFLVNGRMNFWGAIDGNFALGLQHTDVLHKVFEKNAIQQSEATYIGGETFRLCPATLGERPTIAFYWSTFFIHTSAAFTGVDIRVPSIPSTTDIDNPSFVAFYHNGFCADQGTGRSLIMGTDIGALASDLGTIINRDAHNDILQEFPLNEGADIVEILLTRPNNNKVTEGLPATQIPNPLENQYSQHSFFLAHASNISIGTPGLVSPNPCSEGGFNVLAQSVLLVGGSFIAFESQGGLLNQPDTSVETGQGGIFVDQGGLFEVASTQRMSLAAMVGLGFNGAVDFLTGTVFINNLVGITRSNLDMSDPNQIVVVPANANITDFTIDWKYTIKDTCPPSATPNYFPYMPVAVPAACQNPVAVAANTNSVPTILGVVDQLQIENSRLGDPATIKVSGTVAPGPTVTGAIVREVVFNSTTPDSGAAPVAILVIENNGFVGLGSASRNQDSPAAAVVLGINGVTLMPNGDGEVFLNQNAVINTVCQIVAGPAFGAQGENTLVIYSDVPTEIRVKQGATLDLSQFNSANRRLEIGGEVSLIFEPGSRMVLGEYIEGAPQKAEIHFVDNATVRLDALTLPNIPSGSLAAVSYTHL